MKNVDLQVRCVVCNQIKTVSVLEEDAIEYLNPTRERHIQDIFPYLKPEQRELLISNICPECWNDLFPPEDELEGEEYDE